MAVLEWSLSCWFIDILTSGSIRCRDGVISLKSGGGAGPVQDSPGAAVDLLSGEQDVRRGYHGEIISLPKVLTEQAVRVFVRRTLQGAGWFAKVNEGSQCSSDLSMLGHL